MIMRKNYFSILNIKFFTNKIQDILFHYKKKIELFNIFYAKKQKLHLGKETYIVKQFMSLKYK